MLMDLSGGRIKLDLYALDTFRSFSWSIAEHFQADVVVCDLPNLISISLVRCSPHSTHHGVARVNPSSAGAVKLGEPRKSVNEEEKPLNGRRLRSWASSASACLDEAEVPKQRMTCPCLEIVGYLLVARKCTQHNRM